jgi:hypothetical protein
MPLIRMIGYVAGYSESAFAGDADGPGVPHFRHEHSQHFL